ncbi:TauD/TfdA family dioxygenase [Streptomyces sp. CA-181903]|uniref:TauD/TfdA family dioxygenase n=1 Tax=Streptomyces sp. CA-181903 TaxID=3240055 RepID=UPI003D8A0445
MPPTRRRPGHGEAGGPRRPRHRDRRRRAGQDRPRPGPAHRPHSGTPPPRLLGLLCVRPAAHGGETLLASGHTVHNRLLAESPWALSRLYQEFHFGRGTGFDRRRPVFRRHGTDLRVHYNRRGIERAHEEAGAPLTPGDRAALDAVDRILSDPRTALRFPLRRGDLLWLDNAVVLHGRTAFTDSPNPHARRCLARVWVD